MNSKTQFSESVDQITADGFALSWHNKPPMYSREQFMDWIEPLSKRDFENKSVLELGCGNGSLLFHLANWKPSQVLGMDLGAGVHTARNNLANFPIVRIVQGDLVTHMSNGYDVVICIGVLHHLKVPKEGLDSVIRNTAPGGRFHCWVYSREGNGVVILIVEPLRRVCRYLPWRITDLIAIGAIMPFYMYAKLLTKFKHITQLQGLPLYQYAMWIGKEPFKYFRHMAFDALIAHRTIYISQSTIVDWLASYSVIDKSTVYIIQRNGNSWKFGGQIKSG